MLVCVRPVFAVLVCALLILYLRLAERTTLANIQPLIEAGRVLGMPARQHTEFVLRIKLHPAD